MPLPIPPDVIFDAKAHATRFWYLFTGSRGWSARIPDWRTSTAHDGSPLLSVEVAGPGAAHALASFATDCPLGLRQPGDMHPRFDLSTPGRTTLVWRHRGVWVELWHPDTLPTDPVPARAGVDPALVSASTGRPLFGPGGRLTFTRRGKETSRA
ncbi:hypothetical protein [Streptomyces misionensis]|uniref:hypothetical protein n=1 Tax=Streptomyces misionensis TaxID=67331 RepID=UPI00396B83AD